MIDIPGFFISKKNAQVRRESVRTGSKANPAPVVFELLDRSVFPGWSQALSRRAF